MLSFLHASFVCISYSYTGHLCMVHTAVIMDIYVWKKMIGYLKPPDKNEKTYSYLTILSRT